MKAKILGIALAAAMIAPAMAQTPPSNIPTIADMPRLTKNLKDMIARQVQRKTAAVPTGQAPTPWGDSSSTINGVAAAPGWHIGTASVCGARGTVGPFNIFNYIFDSANMVSSNNVVLMLLASQACGNPPYGHQFMWHVIPGAIDGEFDDIRGLYF